MDVSIKEEDVPMGASSFFLSLLLLANSPSVYSEAFRGLAKWLKIKICLFHHFGILYLDIAQVGASVFPHPDELDNITQGTYQTSDTYYDKGEWGCFEWIEEDEQTH